MVNLNVSLILVAIAVAPVLANYSSTTAVRATSSNVISRNSANSSRIIKAISTEHGACKQDAEMPDSCDGSNGWYPLSVVGREGYYCTHGPICTGEFGNCPGPHNDLIYGSTCVFLTERMHGCVPNTECPTTGSKADTPTASSIADNCMITPDTPSHKLSPVKSEDTTYTPPENTGQPTLQIEVPVTAPPTLDVHSSNSNDGTADVDGPETQSVIEGEFKETQRIVDAGAITYEMTSDPKAEFPDSEDASARSETPYNRESSEGPLASTNTKDLATVASETDAPDSDAPETDAPETDAPEIEALTISTLSAPRLRRN
ncbi:unnamed protein product [Peronospora farinosa]|uniref:Uncharacterized protein n=1 Tax=Peronospora farinosa TaxID=134698 RepID=A0AAV0STY2_9STRA|nr:unnamed protein product [Peronospora farinosa]